MKPQFMRWGPDTCECNILTYKDENGDVRIITDMAEADALHREIFKNFPDTTSNPNNNPQRPTKVCESHSGLGVSTELYDVVLNKENRVKNMIFRILLGHEEITDLGLEEINESGGRVLKKGLKYQWSFVGSGNSRKIRFSVNGLVLTQDQKNSIQNLCDQKFGNGRAEIR